MKANSSRQEETNNPTNPHCCSADLSLDGSNHRHENATRKNHSYPDRGSAKPKRAEADISCIHQL